MSANVVDMAARRRAKRRTPATGQINLEVGTALGEVYLALLVGDEGVEAFLDPDTADRLADDIKRHAAAARALQAGKKSSHLTPTESR